MYGLAVFRPGIGLATIEVSKRVPLRGWIGVAALALTGSIGADFGPVLHHSDPLHGRRPMRRLLPRRG